MSLVSVIIPCRNRAAYLLTAVRSVLGQTWGDLECWIVDHGSTDETPEVARALAAQDSRVRCLHVGNVTTAAARNRGIERATGQWIQLLDSDDWLHPDKLRFQLEWAKRVGISDGPVVLYGDYQVVFERPGETGRPSLIHPGQQTREQLLAGLFRTALDASSPLWFGSVLFSESVFRLRWLDEELVGFTDVELFTDLLLRGLPFVYVPFLGAFYRIHGGNTTRNPLVVRRGYVGWSERIAKKNPNLLREFRHMGAVLRQALSHEDRANALRIVRLVRQAPVPVYVRAQGLAIDVSRWLRIVGILRLPPQLAYRAVRLVFAVAEASAGVGQALRAFACAVRRGTRQRRSRAHVETSRPRSP